MKNKPIRYRHPDGTIYLVTDKGWRRETTRHWESKDRTGTHNHSVRRRLAKAA